eukprot:SAG11_NODE_2168_length_3723_cov_2.856000_1_plen_40_part_10
MAESESESESDLFTGTILIHGINNTDCYLQGHGSNRGVRV